MPINVLSQADAARLLRWSMLWAAIHPQDGPEVRKLVLKMSGMLLPSDLLMLAQLADEHGHGWLKDELKKKAGVSVDEEGNPNGE